MAIRMASNRPLPQTPLYSKDRDAAWYEHEERMRPTYITQPGACKSNEYYNTPAPPPLSPSARWSAAPSPQMQQQQQHVPFLPVSSSANFYRPDPSSPPQRLPEQAANLEEARPRLSHLNSAPSRFRTPNDAYHPFACEDDNVRRTGMAKGSAFMHKGFFDIMSLVNNQTSPPRVNVQPSYGGFKATLGKATGRFRKMSNTTAQALVTTEDPFLSSPAPQLIRVASPLSPVSLNRITNTTGGPTQSTSPRPFVAGPRAQKKRISVDMVGAPRIDSFVHAAHASDAEQAEEILMRWGRDGVGKVADPAWIGRCKEAMRVQAARNQAEAIAEVQAALHQESMLRDHPRPLQIVNGAPSVSMTASDLTFATATTATAGHSTLSGGSVTSQKTQFPLQGVIMEEADRSTPTTPRRSLPASPPITSRPTMMPRTNTQGTIIVAPSPDPAASTPDPQGTPDYLRYQPVVVAPTDPDSPEGKMSKAIDGLPGGRAGAIDALFDRPTSMVVRDTTAVLNVARNLAGEQMAFPLVGNAGAALRPSLTTVEKSVAAKIFFENLYYGILKKPKDRDTRKAGLERELANLRLPEAAKDAIRSAWAANETEYLRDLRARVTVNSFNRLKTIGHGAFGVVALIREKGTGELFAMKQLRKADMLRKGQEGHVRAERDLMTSASASANARWIVKLVYSFQDVDHLYLIMEFMGGGDLLNLLIEKDIFAEEFAKFYVAEMILAIHEAHSLGYIHRDIKPDNFLFTSGGHVKLADFGLCQSFHWAHDGAYYDQQRKNMLKKHGIDLEDSTPSRARKVQGAAETMQAQPRQQQGYLNEKELKDVMSDRNEDGTPLTHVLTWRDKNKKKIAYSVVGTNNYMAPEVLRGLGYDQSCDWWSLGVIVFEMLYGYPPFVSKSRHLTRQKILNWKQTLRFPPKPRISREAQDFIASLICEKEDRLGSVSNASVSRPNSLLQGSRQKSGFVAASSSSAGKESGKLSGLADGVDDLMAHPWFRGIDWHTLHASKAPFRPSLSHPADTKHFEDDIEDEPLPAPGVAEAAKEGHPLPVEQPRDPMLRDKAHGQHLLELRKQLAFVGYTFKSPKGFDPKTQLSESRIVQAEQQQQQNHSAVAAGPPLEGSRLRSMSM
ncbi:hypothetical protein CBS101457_004074 [Exobasidium rhododendri]|nr:hypothetical protein CBS101457_004074 [Exobasidium rhododendri]